MNITEQVYPHTVHLRKYTALDNTSRLVGVFTPQYFHVIKQIYVNTLHTVPTIRTTKHVPLLSTKGYFLFPPNEKICKAYCVTLQIEKDSDNILLETDEAKFHLKLIPSLDTTGIHIPPLTLPTPANGHILYGLLKDISHEIGICSSTIRLSFYRKHCGFRVDASGSLGYEVIEPFVSDPDEIVGCVNVYSRDFVYLCECIPDCTRVTVSAHGNGLISISANGSFVFAQCRHVPSSAV
jgi:hypothetical protein